MVAEDASGPSRDVAGGREMSDAMPTKRTMGAVRGLTFERLEPRALLTADGLGVFAIQQGQRTGFAATASAGLDIQAGDFQSAGSGRVSLRIDSVADASPRGFTHISVTSSSPVPQTLLRNGSLLVHVAPGTYAVRAQFGRVRAGADYALSYRLAGDVDGSFSVTAADLAVIRTGMRRPTALTRQQFANADVDGDGAIRARDLDLATANLGAATSIRPLGLAVSIDAATPNHEGVVRLSSARIAAGASASAAVVFANAATGERLSRTADTAGRTTAEVRLKASAENRITVTAEDSFGQRSFRRITVQQRPTPVVIVPGWATSMPRSLFDVPDFLMRLGYPAEKLTATGLLYGDLRHSLAAAGYVRERDQFIVPYDWRLPLAPDDGVRDGVLTAVTSESILRPQPTSALGYLGNFLADLVERDPSIVKVDMLGYSFGGLVSRAYIQSAAYGADFTVGGRTFALPEVDRLMLLATPSQGSAISYPFWNNDAASFSVPLLLGDINIVNTILGPVYRRVVRDGHRVTGPSGAIDRASITDPLTGRPDPRAFLQRYFASLRDMLPTYAFLSDSAGRLSTINDTPQANRILLDLNATSSPGVNPWTANVGQVTATFGVNPRAWLTGWPVTTETYVRELVADGRTGSIWPFQLSHRIRPAAGTTYYEKQTLVAGDDMVPEVSLVATYAGDPTITIKPWGNGTPPSGRTWTRTSSSVRHARLLDNPDVLAFVRSRLTAR